MDPFNNYILQANNDFDTYYDEYYKLYDIEQPEIVDSQTRPPLLSMRFPFLRS